LVVAEVFCLTVLRGGFFIEELNKKEGEQMSFTISDAKTLAHSWIEETLDDAQILIHGNEFLRRVVSNKLWQEDIGDYAESVANTYYDLPTDFYSTVSVTNQTDTDIEYPSSAYTISNGRIKFMANGDYFVTYKIFPALIKAITYDYPLPDAFIYPLAEYLIYRYFNIELDDGDSKAAAMEYEQRCANSLREIYSQMDIDSEGDGFQVKMRW
jgi:hypothetical protein